MNISISSGGDGGIRTLDRPLQAYNGLANRRLQPLGHVSVSGRYARGRREPQAAVIYSTLSAKWGTLKRLGGGAEAWRKCDTRTDSGPRKAIPFALCCRDARCATTSRQKRSNLALRGSLLTCRIRFSAIERRDGFHHLTRFELGPQNRAFLHFSARGKMLFESARRRNRDRAELQFPEIERLIPSQDSISGTSISVEKRGTQPPSQCNGVQNGVLSKTLFITITYSEIFGSRACYLCNTYPKTDCLHAFEAVPLLRVQSASAIVTVRRRGASRGRPVSRCFA